MSGKPAAGFTLLELLIAIALFALLSTACYRILTTVTQAKDSSSVVWNHLKTFQRARVIVQKDISQMVGRPVRSSSGERQFAMSGGQTERGRKVLITFSRAGWYNLLDLPRSDLQRVSYTFEDNQLVRYYWPVMDVAIDSTDNAPFRQVILDSVTSANIRFLDQKRRWSNVWPPASEEQKVRMTLLPAGIRISLNHEYYGAVQWWFPGVGMPPRKTGANSKNDSTPSGDNKERRIDSNRASSANSQRREITR